MIWMPSFLALLIFVDPAFSPHIKMFVLLEIELCTLAPSSSASFSISSFDAQASAANTAASATNQEIEAAADAIIDFTEGNPFGSL